jgi:uncharacterized protein
MTRRILTIAGLAAILAAAVVFAGVGRPAAAHGDTSTTTSTVTTVGHGAVDAVPDTATISAGVRTDASTATAALAANSATITKVIAALRAAGGADLQTQEVSLDPQTDEKGDVTGYEALDTVSADASIGDAGKLIDAAVAAGANTVEGPDLSVSDQDALYRQALARAVGDAKAKAQALATAGGFSVGPVTSVTEQSSETPITLQPAAKSAASTPVEPGTQQVTADVEVSFAIS